MRNDPLSSLFGNNWHPCSQMMDYLSFPYLKIAQAQGSLIHLESGHTLIDAISSWWCKPLGHQHPRLKEAVHKQMNRFEHVLFANTTSDLALALGEKLTRDRKNLKKVFYGGDGSTAIEIALKMSLQYHLQSGHPQKSKFAYLAHAYHGETIFCYSVSDLGLYKDKFKTVTPDNVKLYPIPLLSGSLAEHKPSLDEDSWEKIQAQLEKHRLELAGIIVEPVVQGAAGMKIHPPELLTRLHAWAKQHGIHFIADEIMTGLGRTGAKYACDHGGIEPDFLCLMKNLTAGWIPFSAVMTTEAIYSAFYDDYLSGKGFMHSNTFTGHALGMAISLEALNIYEEEGWYHKTQVRGKRLYEGMLEIQRRTNCLTHIRQAGMIVAGELTTTEGKSLEPKERTGYQVYREAVKKGALLRPLGDTLYFLPPFNILDHEIEQLIDITSEAIHKILKDK